jgi:hypothetical protein
MNFYRYIQVREFQPFFLCNSLITQSVSPYIRTSRICVRPILCFLKSDLQLFHRNGLRIKTTCRAQHWGCYLEGQDHSITLQLNRARPITLLFKLGFYNYFAEMITILRQRVARNICVITLKVKVSAWSCSKIVSGP